MSYFQFRRLYMLARRVARRNRLLYKALVYTSNLLRIVPGGSFGRYDRMFSNVVGGNVVVRVESFNGCFQMGATSHIFRRILTQNTYEESGVNAVKKHLDTAKDVVDVGANVGLYTTLFATSICSTCKVLAIEPSAAAFSHLRSNVVRNGVEQKVILHNCAVSAKAGVGSLSVVPGKEEYSTLSRLVHPSVSRLKTVEEGVQCDTLDSLVLANGIRPGFIKIDVEGGELNVLIGSQKTLEQHKPIVMMEVSDILLQTFGSSCDDIVRFMMRLGYTIIDIDYPASVVKTPFVGDVLALPKGVVCATRN